METRSIALALAATLLAHPAAAGPLAITSEQQRDVMVTIYNGNLGLVRDVREARLPDGTAEVQFKDVASLIDPTSVHLKSLTDPDGLKILEQNWIEHTPKDERVKIKMGNAFDVVGERTQKEWRKLGDRLYEVEWEVVLRNHKTSEQTVTVLEPVPGDWRVLSSTRPWETVDSTTLRYVVPVPAEGKAGLTYRVRIRY